MNDTNAWKFRFQWHIGSYDQGRSSPASLQYAVEPANASAGSRYALAMMNSVIKIMNGPFSLPVAEVR